MRKSSCIEIRLQLQRASDIDEIDQVVATETIIGIVEDACCSDDKYLGLLRSWVG